jgi:hypothetical protein
MTEPPPTLWLIIRMAIRVSFLRIRFALMCWSAGMTVRTAENEVRRRIRLRRLVGG